MIMKYLILSLLSLFFLFMSCKSKKLIYVTIVGCTTPSPRGAALLSNEDLKIYYIDDLSYWEDNFNFRQVVVQGQLKIEKFKRSDNTIDGIPASHIDIKRTIVNATWKLLNKDSDTTLCYEKLIWHRDNVVFPEDRGAR